MSHYTTVHPRRSPSTKSIQLTSFAKDTSPVDYIGALEHIAGRIQRAAVHHHKNLRADPTASVSPPAYYIPQSAENSSAWTLKLEFTTPEAANTAYAAVAEHTMGINSTSSPPFPFPLVPGGFVIAERLSCFVLEDGDIFVNPRDLTNSAKVDWSPLTHLGQSGSLSPLSFTATAPVGAQRSRNNTRGDGLNSASLSKSMTHSTLYPTNTGSDIYSRMNNGSLGFETGHARAYSFSSEDGGYTSSTSSLVSSTTASSSARTSPYLGHLHHSASSSLDTTGFGGPYGHIGYATGSGRVSIHMPEVLDDFDELALSMSNLDVATPVVGTNKQRAPWQLDADREDSSRTTTTTTTGATLKQQPTPSPTGSVEGIKAEEQSTMTTAKTMAVPVPRPGVPSYSNALRKSLPTETTTAHHVSASDTFSSPTRTTTTTVAYHRHHHSDTRSETSNTTTHTKHSSSSSSSSSTSSPHSRHSRSSTLHPSSSSSSAQQQQQHHRKAPRQDKRLYASDPHQGPRPTDWMLSPETLASREARDARFAQIVEMGLAKGRTKAGWAQARRPGKRDRDAAKAKLKEMEEEQERERLRALLGENPVPLQG